MKLPNAQLATVPERKVTHYLLNPGHPAGGSKATFFLRFGFTVAEWQRLAEALLRHARENEVAAMEQTAHGDRYVVDGPLTAPDGSRLNVRSAWYINPGGGGIPRFDRTPVAKTMSTIKELDAVALTCDLPEHRLARGDVGTAVLVHGNGVAFEVEFVGYDGHTVALLTLERDQVRPLQTNDIPHARELVAA